VAFEKSGALPPEKPVVSTAQADIYTDEQECRGVAQGGADGDLGSWLKAHLARSGADDYVALLAYIERDSAHIAALQQMRLEVRDKRHVATCANSARASCIPPGGLQGRARQRRISAITSDDAKDLAVPGQKASFGVIKAAQARGDFDVLTERGVVLARASQGRSQIGIGDARCR